MARGHHADIGGLSVGGYNPIATSVWEEGLRIPPTKIISRGEYERDVWELILTNVRLDSLVEGDLLCQIGATSIGERALVELLDQYGTRVVDEACDFYLAQSEAHMRDQFRGIPDGVYEAERRLDVTATQDPRGSVIRVAVSIEDGEVHVSFAGSSGQVKSYHNSSYANTVSSSLLALLGIVESEAGINWGTIRPINVEAPEGSIVNPLPGAPTSMCTTVTCSAIVEAIWLALANAAPRVAQGLWSRRGIAGMSSGINPRTGRQFAVIHNFAKGGSGAVHGFDGWDNLSPVSSAGARAPDPEIFEMSSPHLILVCEYRTDSAGPGQWRGGHGGVYRVQFLGSTSTIVLEPSGVSADTAPRGVVGGLDGTSAWAEIVTAAGDARRITSSALHRASPGDVLTVASSGGGGYGDPRERDPAAVREDVLDGLLSVDRAREVYGVTLDQ
jgi:N-methylhydantoinase B